MYDTILVTLDGTPTDRAIIEHVKLLAKLANSRLVLLHVADGWAARTKRAAWRSASDGTPTDRAIIEHVKLLAKLANSRLVLLHVADGWAARTYGNDAVSPEVEE